MNRLKHSDVVVIGAGLAGATVAAVLSAAGLRVTIVDGGVRLCPSFGRHVTTDPRIGFGAPLRDRLISALLQPVPNAPGADDWRRASLLIALPAGGSSVLWTGVAHRLDAPTETALVFAKRCLEPFYDEAEAMLGVGENESSPALSRILGRPFTPLRIARAGDGGTRITGPIDILEQCRGPRPRLCLDHLALRLEHRGGVVTSVVASDLATGDDRSISGAVYVIAADAIRSPALLAASGLAPEPGFPVGYWLAEHPLAVARIHATTEVGRLLAAGISCGGGPVRGVRCRGAPNGVHALIFSGSSTEPILHLYWYALGHPREANRVSFSLAESAFGLFGACTTFRDPVCEPELLEAMMAHLESTASLLGRPCPGWRPRLLPLGAAAHSFGTLRTAGPGCGVTAEDGCVLGFSNLYVVGASRIPSPCCTNPVLAVVAMAIATGRAIAGLVPGSQAAYHEVVSRREQKG